MKVITHTQKKMSNTGPKNNIKAENRVLSLRRLLKGAYVRPRKTVPSLCIYNLEEDFEEGNYDQTGVTNGGLLVSTDGFVITNYHSVHFLGASKKINKRFVTLHRGRVHFFDPRIYVALPKHDLALVRLLVPRQQGTPTVRLSQIESPVGAHVSIYGSRILKGQVGGDYTSPHVLRIAGKTVKAHDCLIVNCAISDGYSGSPVLSSKQELVGIVTFAARGFGNNPPPGPLGDWEEDALGYAGMRKMKYVRELLEKAIDEIEG